MQNQKVITKKEDLTAFSDANLARHALAGDQGAFEVIVRRYSTSLFNFIYHFLGDYDQTCDVLQQVFIKFYMYLPKIGTGGPFKPWLFHVARNCCIDELRRRHRYAIQFSQLETEKGENESSFLNEIPDLSPLPEDLAEYHDLQQMLNDAIGSLPPKFRSVVVLRYVSQLSFSEIGHALHMPEATAKTYFHRAKVLLRRVLGSQLQSMYAS